MPVPGDIMHATGVAAIVYKIKSKAPLEDLNPAHLNMRLISFQNLAAFALLAVTVAVAVAIPQVEDPSEVVTPVDPSEVATPTAVAETTSYAILIRARFILI
jgi:hypothetical protein